MDEYPAGSGSTLESGSPSRLSQYQDVAIGGFVDSDVDSYISESEPEPSPEEEIGFVQREEQPGSSRQNFGMNDSFPFNSSILDEFDVTGNDSDIDMDTIDDGNMFYELRTPPRSSYHGYEDKPSMFFDQTGHFDYSIADILDSNVNEPPDSGFCTVPLDNEAIKVEPSTSPKVDTVTVNTYYEMEGDQTEFMTLEKRIQSLNSEEEVEKMIRDPENSSALRDFFDYFQWKLAKAGVISQREVLSIGKKEDVITVNHDEIKSSFKFEDVKEEPIEKSSDAFVKDEPMEDVCESDGMSESDLNPVLMVEPFLNSELNNQATEVFAPSLVLLPPLLPSVSPNISHHSSEPSHKAVVDEVPDGAGIEPEIMEKESDLIAQKIETEIQNLVEALISHKPLVIHVRSRQDWQNCFLTPANTISLKSEDDADYKQINFNHQGSEKYFTLFIHLLGEIYKLLMTNSTCTKRELYYHDPEVTESQRNVDTVLNDISCFLGEPLWKLGVLSSSKGLVAGDLVIFMKDGSFIDGRQEQGVVVPADICGISGVQSDAKYILIVEKDTVFKKLLDDDVFVKLERNLILITGKGYPDVNTRHLVKYLMDTLDIPAYILVDADPHGIEIMFTYRFGSLALSHLENLASPTIQWIGIRPSDIADFELPSLRLTDEDVKKIDEMLQRLYITEELRQQLTRMKETKVKAEIEALSTFSSTYLVDQFLPSTINMSCLRKN